MVVLDEGVLDVLNVRFMAEIVEKEEEEQREEETGEEGEAIGQEGLDEGYIEGEQEGPDLRDFRIYHCNGGLTGNRDEPGDFEGAARVSLNSFFAIASTLGGLTDG